MLVASSRRSRLRIRCRTRSWRPRRSRRSARTRAMWAWCLGSGPWRRGRRVRGLTRDRADDRGRGGVGDGFRRAGRAASPDGSRFVVAFAIGRGAGGRASWPRIQRGASTTPVATQSAPAPALLTQKPMIVAIVEMRPPPPEVAMYTPVAASEPFVRCRSASSSSFSPPSRRRRLRSGISSERRAASSVAGRARRPAGATAEAPPVGAPGSFIPSASGAGEHEARQQQLDRRPRRDVQLPHRRAAGAAVAQVRADLDDLRARGRPSGERGDRRQVGLARLAGLDRPEDLHEAPPALGDRAVDLGVGPAEVLADLLVGVPLRLEHQGAALVRLEGTQRLRGAAHALASGDLLVERALGRLDAGVQVRLLTAHGLRARTADRERLVLDDHLQPRDLGLGLHGIGTAEEDSSARW